jgi:hypothetical protein
MFVHKLDHSIVWFDAGNRHFLLACLMTSCISCPLFNVMSYGIILFRSVSERASHQRGSNRHAFRHPNHTFRHLTVHIRTALYK